MPGDEHDDLMGQTAVTVLSSLSDLDSGTDDCDCSAEEVVALPPLQAVVIAPGLYESYPLPSTGKLTIGRSRSSDLPIQHDSISRQHAALHIDGGLALEDLGSANGTQVRGKPLDQGKRTPIEIGELVTIGSANLVIQRRSSAERARRLWSHDYFESRLDEECARAERSGGSFALLRIHGERDASAPKIQETICEVIRRSDSVGLYSPLEYEVLLADCPPSRAEETVKRLIAMLHSRGLKARAMYACYPRDGRNAYALTARLAAPGASAATVKRASSGASPEIVVCSAEMERVHALVAQVAVSDISVLLLGETGVGKDVIAHAIHAASQRAAGPFVEINCAALSETLLESELFGHEKGAFTGADAAKTGLIEAAEGGTVLLDEIGEMPLATQAKLLRVLEDHRVRRVGALKPRAIDVRFVAATNRDLAADVAGNTFRRDLYYRLNGVSIAIPPLRERPTEIIPLAHAFAARAAAQAKRPAPDFTADAIALLRGFAWPGNVRELRNMIERAVLLCGDAPIGVEHLPAEMMRATVMVARPASSSTSPPINGDELPRARGSDDQRVIAEALERALGNQTKAASLLGISRRTLINRLEKFGLARPRKDKRR